MESKPVHRHHHRTAGAVGRGDAAAEAAAPGHDRDAGGLGRIEAGADRRPRKHHVNDGEGAELGEVLDGGIGLVGAAGGIDDADLVAEFLARLLGAFDIAGVVGLGGADRDETDQRLVLGDRRGGDHCESCGEDTPRQLFHGFRSLCVRSALRGQLANRFARFTDRDRKCKQKCRHNGSRQGDRPPPDWRTD